MRRSRTLRQVARAVREFDFETFLTGRGIDTTARGDELVGICFACNWHRESFYLNTNSGLWMCHYCSARGNAVMLVARLLDLSYDEAVERIISARTYAYDEDDVYDDSAPAPMVVEPFDEPLVTVPLPTEFHPLHGATSTFSQPYRRYAERRGLTPDLIRAYNIGYCVTGRYSKRLVVPVTHLGTNVSFVARAISEKKRPKVDTPSGNEQGSYLFNLDHIWGRKDAVIVEGVFDALALPEIAVATFGKKISDAQVYALAIAGIESVTYVWDADAKAEITKASERLNLAFPSSKVVFLPGEEDPSSIGHAGMLHYLKTALPMSQVLWEPEKRETWEQSLSSVSFPSSS